MTEGAAQGELGVPEMAWGAVSHVGGVRTMNEDAFFGSDRVCLVADGMGGHEAGEVASGLVVELFEQALGQRLLGLSDLEPLLTAVNHRIRRLGEENGTEGMGTTVVGVGLIANGDAVSAVVFNVGDSRCYRLRGGVLEQVTTDHSHVQELIAAGELSVAEASQHPLRNVVTRALGVDEDVRADFTVLDDLSCRLLLCSDGLSGEVDEDTIHGVLISELDPQAAATALVEAVLGGRAPDNVTAVVVDITFDDSVGDVTVPNARIRLDDVEITAPRELPAPDSISGHLPAPNPIERVPRP